MLSITSASHFSVTRLLPGVCTSRLDSTTKRTSTGNVKIDQAKTEQTEAAKKLLEICGLSEADIAGERSRSTTETINSRIKELGLKNAAAETGVGEMTLSDIVKELMKPGRDPRDELPKPMLRTDVVDINSLKEGMELKGTVRNITDFGAFVDIGVHQDGLVHISQLADRYVKHPLDVVKVGDIVNVKILGIDTKKNRISLTMRGLN